MIWDKPTIVYHPYVSMGYGHNVYCEQVYMSRDEAWPIAVDLATQYGGDPEVNDYYVVPKEEEDEENNS